MPLRSFAVSPLGAACIALFLQGATATGAGPAASSTVALSPADDRLLDDIERAGFRFFVEQSHPRTGLVRDRARADGSPSEGKASIAASGFSLAAWPIAVERGWVSRGEALEHVRTMLDFLAARAPRQHGFFYHFMEMDTGARAWNCEVSSIDSALLYAGAIVAREYFADPAVTALVNRLLDDVDWPWFRNGGPLVSLAWHDETGFSRYRWNQYSEHVLMSLLALGSSPRPLEAGYWQTWRRSPVGRYGDYVYLQEPPLFVNQFPQAFMDLRGRRDAFVDFFQNTRLATLAQRQFSLDLRPEFPAWGENLWGLTASDSATGYKAWGGPPRTLRYNALDGTIVPCATAGSLPFAPRETLAVLHHLRTVYGDRLWKHYGFVDAFNPQTGWVNADVLGIDLGISVLQAENLRTGLVWRLFMQSPEAKLSLAKAGFLSTARTLDPEQEAGLLARATAAWHSLQAQPAAAGLQLTALLSAQLLGLVNANEMLADAGTRLAAGPVPVGTVETAQYAAALITLRQAIPALAPEATRQLDRIDWKSLPAPGPELAAASRLAVFLEIAAGTRPAADWRSLDRATLTLGNVQVLAPADAAGALLPGLWLDERAILSGASASQLAYASLTAEKVPASPLLAVLQLDQFPRETFATPAPSPATPEAAAACLITAANLLVHDAIRQAFQQDPLVRTGRAAIAEFGEAAFGPNTSLIAQRELAGTPPPPPPRFARAVEQALPRDLWDWQTVAGLGFKDSDADVRPGDAPLEFRFAVTWDAAALHFHADVTDAPAGYEVPVGRNRIVELFIDSAGDGLVWTGPGDYQFTYRVGIGAQELYHHAPNEASITPTAHGYTIEAVIPWASLGLMPKTGLEFGLTPAAISEGTKEWEPTLKLNWSYHPLRAGVYQLGRVRLI
ncbi:glucoamylase family protein [Opitutus sp. GAS368]|uniref:glucoamylase family protein n=1 Tax=Opitutus sp. GAS368 TaxID=1882749 RepID=UPI001561A144|nr:glucoamylase family protein [Opitutus sp. GAS368]